MGIQTDNLEGAVQAATKRLRDYLEYKLKVARLALTDIVDGTAEAEATPALEPLKRAENVIAMMKLKSQEALYIVGGNVVGPERP